MNKQELCSRVADWRERIRGILLEIGMSPVDAESFTGLDNQLTHVSATLNNIRVRLLEEIAIERAAAKAKEQKDVKK